MIRRAFAAPALGAALAVGVGALPAGAASYDTAPTGSLGPGAFSWFQGARALLTSQGELIGSATRGPGTTGAVVVSSSALQTSAGDATRRHTVTLDGTLPRDDHNAAGLVELANGEILAGWSGHNQDNRLRFAVRSVGKRWTRLPDFRLSGGALTTYSNLFALPDGSVLNLTRRYPQSTPWVYRSTNNGRSWRSMGELVRWSGDPGTTHRPYTTYAQRGARIYFTSTLGHPHALALHGINSPVYSGYLLGGQVYRMDGAPAGRLGGGVQVSNLTPVYAPAEGRSAWTVETTFAPDGNPVAMLAVRTRTVAPTSPAAFRYVQARYTPTGWIARDIAPGGRSLYGTSFVGYAGNAATDPTDPNHVVISTSTDPATGANLGQHDLYEGRSLDGVAWSWARLTITSKPELRPVFTNTVNGRQALVWFAGRYTSYSDFATGVEFRIGVA